MVYALFDGNARVDHWELFNKIIQKQKKKATLDAGLKYAPHSDRFWVRAQNINFSIMAEII